MEHTPNYLLLKQRETNKTQYINRRCQKPCKGLKMESLFLCQRLIPVAFTETIKPQTNLISFPANQETLGWGRCRRPIVENTGLSCGTQLRDMRGCSRSSKGRCASRGRCDGSRRPPCWGSGERSPASRRYTGVSLPRFPVRPERSQNMAKKRAERREADGMSASEDEIKANARNSQALKGGLCLWWLNSTVCSVETKQNHEQAWTKHNETVFLILLRVTGWQNSNFKNNYTGYLTTPG